MNIQKNIFLFLFFFSCTKLFAGDTIIVHKDPRLDILTLKQAMINKRATMMTSAGLYRGYRLQVLSSNNRDLALKTKADLLGKYPEHKTYVLFQSPYFKVRFGNFLKRADAEKMRKEMNRFFPQGVFVVEDAVEYTPIGDEDINN